MNVNARTSAILTGLGWMLFSPITLLMALISSVESQTIYFVQVAAFGLWAVFGVVSGIGTVTGAPWAGRIQKVLKWAAFAYFTGCGLLLAGYIFSVLLNNQLAYVL